MVLAEADFVHLHDGLGKLLGDRQRLFPSSRPTHGRFDSKLVPVTAQEGSNTFSDTVADIVAGVVPESGTCQAAS